MKIKQVELILRKISQERGLKSDSAMIDNFLIRVSVVGINVNPTPSMNRYVLRKVF